MTAALAVRGMPLDVRSSWRGAVRPDMCQVGPDRTSAKDLGQLVGYVGFHETLVPEPLRPVSAAYSVAPGLTAGQAASETSPALSVMICCGALACMGAPCTDGRWAVGASRFMARGCQCDVLRVANVAGT